MGLRRSHFDIPAGVTFGTFNVRFRLYPASTGGSAAPVGFTLNGEVEDYQWAFHPTAVDLVTLDARSAASPSSSLPAVLAALAALGLAAVLLRLRRLPAQR